uniref:phosphoribosyl-ATP diphosphatase n=1 Tax=Haptolina ericina TaxID=156174 RepID=A0A7S3BK70_9EUKA
MRALQATLIQRKREAPAGSYTKRLFDDPELLRNKLVEEAQELAEATEGDHVASEAADLLYFAMVRCVAAGVGIREVESHLDRRTFKLQRRPGNAKKDRIDAASAILKASADKKAPTPKRSSPTLSLIAPVALLYVATVLWTRFGR